MMGSMFPRLHVNDKEKGGPRAPPRNKMALYEQLSIPSRRFNPVTQIVQEKREGDEDERDSGQTRIFSLTTNSKEDIARKCKANGLQDQELEDLAVSTSAKLFGKNNNVVEPKSKRDKRESEIPRPRTALSCSDENHANPKQCDDVYAKGDSPQKGKIDRTDAVSETSMVDSISCSDVSPDDVVGVIGQRQFWKARETIANQQRVFAFQLFELHRLIKVQQLIAGSPQLCVEDGVFLASSTPKVSPTAKLSSRCIDKLPPPVMNSEASKKSNHKMECSAENAMADGNTASWCFPQLPVHQWLIPVMSPSEGLVFKPCPAPGFIGTFPPPYGSSQLMGGFANPTQGNGVFPINLPTGHHYIHPYSMSPMNSTVSGSVADQTKSSCRTGSNRQQSCTYVPTQKSGFVPSVACTASELQTKTGSCNSEKDQTSQGRNSPIVTRMDAQAHCSDCPNGVIKVVPRNPRSAAKSAARIFQSIQEERKVQSM